MTMSLSRRQAEAQRQQAHQDLDDLDRQVAEGEIDPTTATMLRVVYHQEAEEADRQLAAPPEDEFLSVEMSHLNLSRRLLGTIVMAVVLAAVILSVAGFIRTRAPGASLTGGFEGVARSGFDQSMPDGVFDPAAYSDEALEGVVQANADDPQISGMRIALADRYFSRGDYQAAFPHYQAVLEIDPPPSPILVAAALSRLGWIVYEGNGEVELALSLFDQALALRPDDPLTTYLKGLVLWCGVGQPAEAVGLLEKALSSTQIDEEARAMIEGELAAARDGGSC